LDAQNKKLWLLVLPCHRPPNKTRGQIKIHKTKMVPRHQTLGQPKRKSGIKTKHNLANPKTPPRFNPKITSLG